MSNKFIVGSKVKWVSYPRKGSVRGPAIKCVGTVLAVKRSVFGGKRKDMGAVVKVTSKAYREHHKKDRVFISFKSLEKA